MIAINEGDLMSTHDAAEELPQSLVRCGELLIAVSRRVEAQLADSGQPWAHEGMFHLRELLHDLQRLQVRVADLGQPQDIAGVLAILNDVNLTMLYEIAPHAEHHMLALQKLLAPLVDSSDGSWDEV
jgi:hypothetical protein